MKKSITLTTDAIDLIASVNNILAMCKEHNLQTSVRVEDHSIVIDFDGYPESGSIEFYGDGTAEVFPDNPERLGSLSVFLQWGQVCGWLETWENENEYHRWLEENYD